MTTMASLKVGEYFSAGTAVVWVVDPAKKSVAIHHPGGDIHIFSGNDMVKGEGLLSEFSFTPAELFRP